MYIKTNLFNVLESILGTRCSFIIEIQIINSFKLIHIRIVSVYYTYVLQIFMANKMIAFAHNVLNINDN